MTPEHASATSQDHTIATALARAWNAGRITRGQWLRGVEMQEAGAYLDAVLVMLPEGWGWDVGNDSDAGGWAEVYHPEHAGKHSGGTDAATPALALLAAIEKANA